MSLHYFPPCWEHVWANSRMLVLLIVEQTPKNLSVKCSRPLCSLSSWSRCPSTSAVRRTTCRRPEFDNLQQSFRFCNREMHTDYAGSLLQSRAVMHKKALGAMANYYQTWIIGKRGNNMRQVSGFKVRAKRSLFGPYSC